MLKKELLPKAEQYAKQNKRKSIWRKLVRTMACFVVFCTTYALILPAITMERQMCEVEEHIHSDSCYVKLTTREVTRLACDYDTLEVHEHGPECLDADGKLVCGLADYVVHEHDASCRDANGALVCILPEIKEHEHTEECYQAEEAEEHVHDETCYTIRLGELVCELTETEGHTHTEECKTRGDLVCGQDESEGHAHGEACSETILVCDLTVEPHVHGDSCWTQLVCELTEDENHTHSEECSGVVLNCDLTEQPHVHGDGCYQTNLLCDLPESAGHSHDDSCYAVAYICGLEESEGHSHEGSCYEQVEELTCQPEETEPTEPAEPELICEEAVIKLHTHDEDDCYEIYLDENEEEQKRLICEEIVVEEHIHSEACFVTEEVPLENVEELTCGQEEGETHTHTERCYGSWELVCGKDEHTHNEECTPEPETTYYCAMEAHSHSEECLDEEGNLICELEEHVHTEECTQEIAATYYCGKEEHTHTEECSDAEGNLICALEEHVHTEECTQEITATYYCGKEEHTHTEECSDAEGNLICALEEHVHTEECTKEITITYYCGMEEHTHTEECTDAEGNLICELEEHVHGEECTTMGDPIPECDCGSEIELKNHPNGCARYQYLRYTYIHEKTADEIYANWEFMNEEDHGAILAFMSWEYTLSEKLAKLEQLLENRDPLKVEFDDGTVISVEGIPEDAILVASVGTEEQQAIADILNISLDSVTDGYFLNTVYDISVLQGEEIWQPSAGDDVTLTVETNEGSFNYRSYLQITHILDDVDAIQTAIATENYSVHTQAGLSEIFPEECEAAMAAGYGEDTIIYTVMTPEGGKTDFNNQGEVTINADSFSTYIVTAFNVNNNQYMRGVAGEVEGELIVDKHVSFMEEDKFMLELEAFITGQINSAPTDVVLVVDHSGSMWSAVDPAKKLSFSNISSDTVHGAREGYYIVFGKNEDGNDAAALVRYYNGQWQRSEWFASGNAIEAEKGFINTVIGTTRGWTELSATDKTYTYYKSISGALYDALNIFMEEMQYAIDCRVAVVTFSGNSPDYNGSGIFVDGSLVFDTVGTPGLGKTQYQNAFEDPSSTEGRRILAQTISAINTDYGHTATGVGLLYARRLFLQASSDDRNKVAIVFTDGIPSPSYIVERGVENKENSSATDLVKRYGKYGYQYETTVDGTVQTEWVSTYADQACSLRNEGAVVYSIGPTSGNAGTKVLSEMASGSDYFFSVGESDLRSLFKRIASVVVESSVALDENAYMQDIIAGDFTLPAGVKPSDVEAYVVPCTGKNYTFETDESKWTRIDSKYVTIDTATNTVQVRGFDYSDSNNFVIASKAGGNKILVRIPIDAVNAGNKFPTNTGVSAVCNQYGSPAKYFPLPYADVPTDVTISKQLTGNVMDPEKKFDFSVSYTKWTGYNSIDGGAEGDSNYLQTIQNKVQNETFRLGDDETKEFNNLHVGSTLTITETMLPGYYTSVKVNGETIYPDETGTITLTVTPGMDIIFVNCAGYELPETGGAGTYLYTMGGLLLIMAAAVLLYIQTTKRRKEEMSSF